MAAHEFNRLTDTEIFKGESVTLVINDANKIATTFIDRETTSRVYLALDAEQLPPPIVAMKFELNPEGEKVEGVGPGATPPSIYATIALPESHISNREQILQELVSSFKEHSVDTTLERHDSDSDDHDTTATYYLFVGDNPPLRVSSWPNGIGIRAFAGTTALMSNDSLGNFYSATIGVIDQLSSYYPIEAASNQYEINIRMPVEEPVAIEIEAEKEWLPQHSYGSFEEVGGLFDAKERLKDIGLAWQHPEIAKKYGIDVSHFILVGPPGTGKTTLINAFANEFDATVINVKSSEIINAYIGRSAYNLTLCFANALQQASDQKIVLLFDEIDSIIGTTSSQSREYIQTINTLKQELDALKHSPHSNNIIFAGATNVDADSLDPAITRSGRVDLITAPYPNTDERIEIWNKLIFTPEEMESRLIQLEQDTPTVPSQSKFAADISLQRLADLTENKTGADFKEIIKRVNRVKFRRAVGLAAARQSIVSTEDKQQLLITQVELEDTIRRFGIN